MAPFNVQHTDLFQRLDRLQSNIALRPDETALAIRLVLDYARETGAVNAIARAIYLLALCALQKEEYERAISILDQDNLYSGLDQQNRIRMQIWAYRGAFLQKVGLFQEAMQSLWQSQELARQIGDRTGEFLALHNISYLHSEVGYHKEALDLQRQALAIAKELGEDRFIMPSFTGEIGNLFLMQHYQEVVDLAPEILEYVQKRDAPLFFCTLIHDVSLSHMKLGNLHHALQMAERAEGIARQSKNLQAIAEIEQALGQIFFELGQTEKALRYLTHSVALAEQTSYRLLLSRGHLHLSEAHEKLGNHKEAFEHIKRHYESEKMLMSSNEDVRARYLTSTMRYDLIQREAEIERLKNVELVNANRTLQLTQLALLHQATHDSLTGAVNRSALLDKITKSIDSLKDDEHAGLIFVDIDHFKSINDLYGHRIGDEVLKETARRLCKMVRSDSDVVARVGGDEFVILLSAMSSPETVYGRAQELLEELRKPYYIDSHQLDVTASVGCAVAPQDGQEAAILQQSADLAMYSVKRSDRNKAARFSADMALEQIRRQKLERELRGAAERNELQLYYQGRFSLHGLSLVGFEALIRWQHPEQGLVPPNQFIPLAEETGLILAVGTWVLHEACRQAKVWHFAERGLTMSLNVSPLQFEQDNFLETVKEAVKLYQLEEKVLIIEITESLVLRNLERAKVHIAELQKMGVKVALDDFGKGYSSLGVIHTLPINHLKIDRSFMQDLQNEADQLTAKKSKILLETMIDLAQKLNMQVTAEGVENSKQLEVLTSLSCDYVQGFYCARPFPPAEAALMLPEQWKAAQWDEGSASTQATAQAKQPMRRSDQGT